MATNDLTALLLNPEITGLERQRRMAQALVQTGLETPQSQMVGNRYVPVNPLEFIGNLAMQYKGQNKLKDIDKQELALAEALRKQDLEDLQTGMQLYQGAPEKTIELAGPYGQGVGAEGANVPMPVAYTPQQAANPQAAMAYLLGSKGPKSSAVGADLYKQMFREPKWEKSELPDANGNVKVGWVNVNAPNPASTFIIGGTKPDIELAKGRYEGYLPEGGGFGPQSNAGASAFAPAMAKVFSFEGDAFVPKDGLSGAPAKFGINQKANPDIDVKNLTKSQAEAIYKTRYWDAINGDALPAKTAEIAFDAAVNQGPAYAKQLIAQTGGDPVKMLQQRAQDYTQLVQSDPRQAQYLPSWMNRLQVLSKDVANYSTPSTQNVNTAGLSPKARMAVEQKTAEARAEYAQKAPAAMEFMNQTINNINAMIGDTTVDAKGNIVKGKIEPHPGFEGAVGVSGIGSGFGAAGYIPGTDVQDFKARFKQLEGQGFLQAFETLKGAGQITEVEGAKATAALNRMNLAQSEKEFITAAREFESNVKKGMEIAKERAGIPTSSAKSGWSVISVTPGK